eukprot:SAG31_NODE_116_length_24094_cov_38.884184_20_plen_66_part_00
MLAAEGSVRLADFGCAEELARFKPEDTCRKTLGSPAFQSPGIVAIRIVIHYVRYLLYAMLGVGTC